MNQERIHRIVQGMKERGMDHLLISDPVAIFYLLGRKIAPASACSSSTFTLTARRSS